MFFAITLIKICAFLVLCLYVFQTNIFPSNQNLPNNFNKIVTYGYCRLFCVRKNDFNVMKVRFHGSFRVPDITCILFLIIVMFIPLSHTTSYRAFIFMITISVCLRFVFCLSVFHRFHPCHAHNSFAKWFFIFSFEILFCAFCQNVLAFFFFSLSLHISYYCELPNPNPNNIWCVFGRGSIQSFVCAKILMLMRVIQTRMQRWAL